jgi:AcrR family transcriptional regulator
MSVTEPAATADTPATGPGRPRDPRIDEAVLDATTALLEEVGYQRLSIAAIAARAGTTPPAIYRRWPTKTHLVHEAVFPSDSGTTIPMPLESDHPDLAAVLRAMLVGGIALLARPAARAAVPGLLAELRSAPEMQADLRARFDGGEWGWLEERLDRAVAQGEIRADLQAATLLDLISGSAFMAAVVGPAERIDDQWIDQVVDIIMRGIALPPTPTGDIDGSRTG